MDLGYTKSQNALPVRASEARVVGSRRSSTYFSKRSGNLSNRSSSGGEDEESSWSSPPAGCVGGACPGPPPGASAGVDADMRAPRRSWAGRAREGGSAEGSGGAARALLCGEGGEELATFLPKILLVGYGRSRGEPARRFDVPPEDSSPTPLHTPTPPPERRTHEL